MTTTTKPVSIRDNDGLSDMQIERYCPSVFAVEAHESRSSRYFYIPTKQILAALRSEGFFPTAVMQSGSRIEGKGAFTKHLVRFRRQEALGIGLNEDVHEIVLINSHDGTSAYDIMSGIFRLVCTNGLVKGDVNSRIKVYHKGSGELDNIISATYKIAEMGDELMETVEEMKHISLNRDEQLLLAKYAMYARFDLDRPETEPANVVDALPVTTPIIYQPADFLRTRRSEDRADDLYTVTNKVQENVIKGGVRRRDAKGQKHTVREVKGIDQSVKVNSLIWSFAEELRKFKQQG